MATIGGSLAVILGASEWPKFPSFETRPAFQNSANFFRNYLLRGEGIGLSSDNLLWLFNDEGQPGIIIEKIKKFLRERANVSISNIFFFYVGHGSYLDEKNYFVALRCTDEGNRHLTVLPVKEIAKALYRETPDKRHIIFIDACYATGAVKDFIYQDDPSVATADVSTQIRKALPETDIKVGTTLFCAAGPKTKAKAPWEDEYTMFSGALHRVLYTGDPDLEDHMSLEEVAKLVEKDISNTFRTEAVKPYLLTPSQEEGDIRVLRLFPNPARRREVEGQTAVKLRSDVDKLTQSVDHLSRELQSLKSNIELLLRTTKKA